MKRNPRFGRISALQWRLLRKVVCRGSVAFCETSRYTSVGESERVATRRALSRLVARGILELDDIGRYSLRVPLRTLRLAAGEAMSEAAGDAARRIGVEERRRVRSEAAQKAAWKRWENWDKFRGRPRQPLQSPPPKPEEITTEEYFAGIPPARRISSERSSPGC